NSDHGFSYHTVRDSAPDGTVTLNTDGGLMQVWMVAKDCPLHHFSVKLVAGRSIEMEVEFAPTTERVTGRVVDVSGSAIQGIAVFCLPIPNHGAAFSAFLDKPFVSGRDGRFSIPLSGLPTDMKVFAQRGAAISRVARVRGGANFDLPLVETPSTLALTVSGLSLGLMPWHGCTLAVVAGGNVSSSMDWGVLKSRVPLNVAANGIDQVFFAGPGERVMARGLTKAHGNHLCMATFDVEPSEEAFIVVRDDKGNPKPRMTIELVWRQDVTLPWESAQTDSRGQGRIRFREFGRVLAGVRIANGVTSKVVPIALDSLLSPQTVLVLK
ncbi:MAG: hypothetical protein KAI24_20820, partial [Planctomycetes bacterium]|nr:hypothetical protein [Planctomycetota bacterium]